MKAESRQIPQKLAARLKFLLSTNIKVIFMRWNYPMYLQSFVHAGKYNTNYQQYDIETVNYYLFPTSR